MIASLGPVLAEYLEFHQTCMDATEEFGFPGNLVRGAGFIKVARAMAARGLVERPLTAGPWSR